MQKFYLSDADATIQKLQNQLREAQITIEEQNSTIDSLQSDIHTQQQQINELNATIDSQQSEIVSQQAQIGELNATVDTQRSTINSQQSEIHSQQTQIDELNATINSQQSQIASQQTQIDQMNATINSQLVVISSQRSQIEQLQSLLSEPPTITYMDYPLCMDFVSIELATQEDWRFLALHYKDESGSHFWWLTDGTSQIRYQYDKMWLINKRATHFALLNFTTVHVSHAGSEVSSTHSKLSAPSKWIFTQCYTDTPYILLPIGVDQGGIRTLKVNATGNTQFVYVSLSELTSKTFPIFLLNAEE
jgi:predicted RNase H-like nuclease (RuvC/YqgF family)